jgi:aspartate carbamoyltransferase catalytic subunit
MNLKRKDLLAIRDLDVDELRLLLDTAESFKEVAGREIKKVPTLRGRTVVNLFFEPSTRTRASFELAAKRLSADVINVSASSSSVVKGETLLDTAKNLEAMGADVIVVRHGEAGAPALLGRHLRCSVINAGDGAHEHPTQAILDLSTILERKGQIEGLTVTIVGDVRHSRVARSNLWGLTKLGATVRLAGPPTMVPPELKDFGAEIHHALDSALDGADVVMALRLQLERQGAAFFPSLREYSRLWGLTREGLQRAKPDVLVMHPGPVNRGVELAPDVADGLSSVILGQVANGIAVRMAALYLLTGGKSDSVTMAANQ